MLKFKFARATGALLLLAALGAAAHADGSLTRAQVKAELAEAQRTGNILAGVESGLTLRELNPQCYPSPAVAQGKTRTQVREELADATRMGDIFADNESGLTAYEEHPQLYPARATVTGNTRAQVKTELAQAIRTGDMLSNDESGLKLNQEHPQRYARVRATMAAQAASTLGSATQ